MSPAVRGELPPVTVDCRWCESQFLSRARDQQPVHCPRCGHSVRVKRRPAELAAAAAAEPAPPAPVTVTRPPAAVQVLPDEDLDDEDDDGGTYMYDQHGNLIPAEWSPEHGLIPLQVPAWRRDDELANRGYRENLNARPGGCRITETRPSVHDCPLAATEVCAGLRVCDLHHYALTANLRTSPT